MNSQLLVNRFLSGLWLVLVFWGCQTGISDREGSQIMQIETNAGTMPIDPDWNFLAYPCHFGYVDEQPTLLISKNNRPAKKVSVMPLAVVSFQKGEETYKWLIANDANTEFAIQDLNSIDDLMTKHNGIKSTLERWIINQYGIGEIMLKGWNQPSS